MKRHEYGRDACDRDAALGAAGCIVVASLVGVALLAAAARNLIGTIVSSLRG